MSNNAHGRGRARGLLSGAGPFTLSGVALSGVALSVVAMAGVARAADAQAAPEVDNGRVQEVVVTALKRQTSLLDAPAAVSAVPATKLQSQQITSLTDLSSSIPSLQVGDAAGVSLVTIRGISLDAIIGGIEGSVAIHQDGVYLSQSTPLDFLLMDAGSVEVLRGPQGTLYGRNATGGAINVIPAKPTADFGGYVNLSYANFQTWRGEAAVSGPLGSDKILGRLAVLGETRVDGYARDTVSGARLGTDSEAGVRAALRLLPSTALTIDVSGYYFKAHNTADFWTNLEPVSAAQLALNPDFAAHPVSYDPRRPAYDFDPLDRQTDGGALVTADWRLSSHLSLRSSTSYTDLAYQRLHVDCDGTATPTCSSNRLDSSHAFQQELDLKFNQVAGRLTGVAGVFYDHDSAGASQFFPWNNPAQGFVNVDDFPLPNGSQTEQLDHQVTESVAVFTDATLKVAPWLDLYGGARWSHDARRMTLTSGLGLTPSGTILLGCTDMVEQVSYSDVSGKAGLQVHLSSQGQFYAQWQQGFKAGGFNAAACGSSFKPESITAYEMGYKTRALEGRLQLSLAAFHYDYDNLQVAQIVGVSYSITNAATAKVDGVEVDGTFAPVRHLQIDGQASILNARYGPYFNTDPLNLAAGIQDLTGHRLNRAPRFSGTLGAQYVFDVAGHGDLTLRGELVYSSTLYFRPFNTALDAQKAYTTGNAFLIYEPAGSRLQLRAFVRNLANTAILAGVFSEDVTQTLEGQYQPPRTYGVGLKWKF